MSQRRWSLAALAFAPILALGACDQLSDVWERMTGGAGVEQPGPAPLDDVPLDARALSGAVQPQAEMAAVLAPDPVLIAPGQILVGAQVDRQLSETATDMGIASSLTRALRNDGVEALEQLPDNIATQLRSRAETTASAVASNAAQDTLRRLGISGEIRVRPGGVVTVDLTSGVSPTSYRRNKQQQGGESVAGDDIPDSIEYSPADRCPRIVSQAQLENDIALATRCAIQRLAQSGDFEYVEPNYIADSGFTRPPRRDQPSTQTPPPSQPTPQPPATTTPAPQAIGGVPNDPLYSLQWNYRASTGANTSPGGAGFVAFWEAHQVGARNVRVAVIDTGLDLSHPDIRGAANVTTGIDLINNPERGGDGDGIDAEANDSGDRCGATAENSYHGTHVAGTIGAAATNDRVGVAGGAWNVTVIPVRVLGRCGGELADIVSGIRWAAGIAPAITAGSQQLANSTQADIINMSLTIQAPCPASMQAAIDAAVARNVVIVVAAGNKANRTALYAPANCNNVIVVGANDARGGVAFYSNFGPEVDILAPGGDVFADSDNDGRPDGVLSTRATQSGCYDPLNSNSTERCYYSFLQGTSMAAPHVSAALALIAAQTGLRGSQLENALFTRAVSPFAANFGEIECARSANASPISTGSPTCARPSGRGRLDLALAARTIAASP